jgi:hypothetical protein
MNIRSLLLAALLIIPASDALAQGRGRGRMMYGGDPNEFFVPPDWRGNAPYDGRITFARIKYRGYSHFNGREGPGWAHDYPRAESHFMRIIRAFVELGEMLGGVIVGLEDPELFKYPFAYFSEPGGWQPTEKEVAGMRNYLLKGGFIIFDDFAKGDFGGGDWIQFQEKMKLVLPKHQLVQLEQSHPIFDSFYKINFSVLEQADYGRAEYWGIFQDNDPRKRLMIIVNLNGDIGEHWQWSDLGYNIAPTNEAYKLGVNYLIYALTH